MGNRKRDRKSAAGAAADGGREPGRFSARRKSETILRLLRGQPLDSAARELGVTAATLAQRPSGGSSSWRAARPPRRPWKAVHLSSLPDPAAWRPRLN